MSKRYASILAPVMMVALIGCRQPAPTHQESAHAQGEKSTFAQVLPAKSTAGAFREERLKRFELRDDPIGVDNDYRGIDGMWVSPRTKRRVKPATVNRELACLKALFNHVLKADVPLCNPVSRIKFCEEHNEQTRVLSLEEQETYLEKATLMLRDVATLMLETGMRPEEVYRIRRENVQLEQGFLAILFGKTKRSRAAHPGAADGFTRRVLVSVRDG